MFFFGSDPVEQDNWQPRINKLEKSLNLWKSRSLSLIGKSLIINVLAMSKFFYLAKVLTPPYLGAFSRKSASLALFMGVKN